MKKLFAFFLGAILLTACANADKTVFVVVRNNISLDRSNELIEVDMATVAQRLNMSDTAQIIVLNPDDQQVPYQITNDNKVLFPATVSANKSIVYRIEIGTPEAFGVKACGKCYPERVDDVAWENDLIAFRTYGPALQASGEKAYGFDVWVKRGTTDPVVEDRYKKELNPEVQTKLLELKKKDPKAADAFLKSISYHYDHGNGLDCYKVGPTLGACTPALMRGDSIIYPYCYHTQEILDNGPLRFTVKLVYNPVLINGDSIVETRIIYLDAGTHLNKMTVSYLKLKNPMLMAVGIVLHDEKIDANINANNDYISYSDPTDRPNDGYGKIFVGAVFPDSVEGSKSVFYPSTEIDKMHDGTFGHVLASKKYMPNTSFTYYWGAAWSEADIKTFDEWNAYLKQSVKKLRAPLQVSIQE